VHLMPETSHSRGVPTKHGSKERMVNMKSESMSAAAKRLTTFALVLAVLAIATPRAQTQTFGVVHSFTGGSDGGGPFSGFTIDAKGNLYGTTSAGGSSGAGVVFKLDANGVETVLHNFTGGTDGASPESSLVMDAVGNLYGTTMAGGTSNAGTVFRVTPKGKETVLYTFNGKPDGGGPVAGLAMDSHGDIYGTTTGGGANGNGTVFKLVHPHKKGLKWKEKVLYSFGLGSDGTIPVAGVTLDASGNLYGTASAGGVYSFGTVFQLKRSKSGWIEHVLYNFQNQNDGAVPYAGLIFDSSGNLYGAATEGGSGAGGGGTIFELTRAGSSWTFNVLYGLAGSGISGTFRDLLLDASGNIYATTHCDGTYSSGTVYKLTPSSGTWTYTLLYTFTGGSDGLYSFSNLVSDKQGNLYGTTNIGGANGRGVIFEIKP
jgi:uncharacterized repeat protein (TIGR03803 family)